MDLLSKAMRKGKDIAFRRSDTEVLVRDATNNDPIHPSGTAMRQIADLTYHPTDYSEIMTTLWERVEDTGKNWRHVYKGLLVMDYLIKNGSDRVPVECRFKLLLIKTLTEFQYIDEEEKDQGMSVRQRAKAIVELLSDTKRLATERANAAKNRDKFGQSISSDGGYSSSGVYSRGSVSGGGSSYGGGNDYDNNNGYPNGRSSKRSNQSQAQNDASSSEDEEEREHSPERQEPRRTKSAKNNHNNNSQGNHSSSNNNGNASRQPRQQQQQNQPDLFNFENYSAPPAQQQQQQRNDDFFDPRGNSRPPQQQQQQQQNFFAVQPNSGSNNNQINFFDIPPPQQQQQAPPVQQPQQSQLPRPQQLPNGNYMIEGHEITPQQFQQYLAFLQSKQQVGNNQPQQQQPQQVNGNTAAVAVNQSQNTSAEDDWNDFTGSTSKPVGTTPSQQQQSFLSPSQQPSSPQQPQQNRSGTASSVLDISSLGMDNSYSSRKSNEPTLAQLQAQKQAQAQQQAFGGGGFGQMQQQQQYGQVQGGGYGQSPFGSFPQQQRPVAQQQSNQNQFFF